MGLRTPARLAAAVAVLALVFAPEASSSVLVATGGWAWGDPSPQGLDLRAVDFAGSRGYAISKIGTILRTDDSGATWSTTPEWWTVDGQGIQRMQVLDSDTVIVLGGYGCLIQRSDDAAVTFRPMFTPIWFGCPEPAQAVTFVDDQVGYILLVNGGVLRTSDAGKTFDRRTAVPPGQVAGSRATDILFTSKDTGIAFVSAGGAPSAAYRTDDGAASWKPITVPNGNVQRLYALDAKTLLAVGPDTLLVSEDGGVTWTARPAARGHDITSIRCSDPKTCLLTTSRGDVLLRTTDGGQTFTATTPSSLPMVAVSFASPTRVVAVGQQGAMVASDDGGVSYSPISHSLGVTWHGLRPGATPTTAYAFGDKGGLAVTVDGGQSWKTLGVPTYGFAPVVDASFRSADVGYAIDGTGWLLGTKDGGATWQQLDPGTRSPRAVLATSDAVLLLGPTGILRSTSGPFTPVGGKRIASARLTTIEQHGGVVTAAGGNARNVFISTDQGNHWQALATPGHALIRNAEFFTARSGWVLTSAGRIFKTANGGKTWTESFVGNEKITNLSMASATDGFVAFSEWSGRDINPLANALIMRTSDGGATWGPQEVAPGTPTAVLASSADQGYLLVGNRELFFTQSGGYPPYQGPTFSETTRVRNFTPAALRRVHGRITITGAIPGDGGGQDIVVSKRDLRGGPWTHQHVLSGANGGSYTTRWTIKRSSVFVAQVGFGRGAPPLIVRVSKGRS